MTREQATEILPIIKAYSEGEQIQIKLKISKDDWEDIHSPNFDSCNDSMYRVKPEKKLVSFTFEDADFLLGKTVVLKSTGSKRIIVGVVETGVQVGNGFWSFYEFRKEYTFRDGTPCGKYIEE